MSETTTNWLVLPQRRGRWEHWEAGRRRDYSYLPYVTRPKMHHLQAQPCTIHAVHCAAKLNEAAPAIQHKSLHIVGQSLAAIRYLFCAAAPALHVCCELQHNAPQQPWIIPAELLPFRNWPCKWWQGRQP